MENIPTHFLVKALKKGDITSLEKVYKMYYSKLYWFSKKFDSVILEPDDFVQQTFLILWDKRDHLKEDVLLDKQIYAICKNLILNHLKRETKTVAQMEEKNFPKEDELEDEDQKSKDLKKLHYLIDRLPGKRKKIYLLHKINNLTYEEIAVYLEISKKTIANHIYLAHNFIKEESQK